MAVVTFDEATHTYRMDGIVVPSVTQCLEPCHDFRFVNPKDLERAQIMGRKVHKTVELYELGRLDIGSLHHALAAHLEQWIKAKEFLKIDVISTERMVYSSARRYAGTMDIHCRIAGEEHIIDIKSGARMKPHALQTAGYKYASVEMGVVGKDCKRGCIYLTPEDWRIEYHSGLNDELVFLSLLNYSRWKADTK